MREEPQTYPTYPAFLPRQGFRSFCKTQFIVGYIVSGAQTQETDTFLQFIQSEYGMGNSVRNFIQTADLKWLVTGLVVL